MTAANVDVEQIVRQVLRQLQGTSAPAASAVAAPTPVSAPAPSCGELRLGEPVVTLSRLTGQLEGIATVIVGSAAVVTPAARDLLKQRGIELIRQSANAKPPKGQVVLGVAETNYDAAGLARMLTQHGIGTERLAQCGLLAAVDEVTDAVARGGKIGVLLTRQTAAVLCLANRARGVQAVLATSVDAVRSARTTFGANLLVIDASGRGMHDLAGMIRACASIPANCLEALKERLN